MKGIVKCLLVTFVISILGCPSVWAQTSTARISGAVKDSSGAVLPGVEVTATQTATGLARSAVSDETGSYSLPNLAVGPYRLEAALPGFRTHVQTGIVLEVNGNPVINLVLEVGQVTEQVEVQANAALVETRTVGVGQIMENERIVEVPLNGRNVTDLIMMLGAAVQTGTSDTRSMPNQERIRVAGGQEGSTTFSLDGATHNNPYDNLNLPLPFPDALQEFKVETSALSPSQGQHTGAQVNAVTKSGTNAIHGDLFEFVRNDLFNARQYFSLTHSTLKRNQFGGTVGGPVVRNKVFFFGGYQGSTIRSDPANIQSWVPTAAALAGDFTTLASPDCNSGKQINLPAALGFTDNRINPALFSPAALNLAKQLPTPIDQCGLVVYGNQQKDADKQIVGKVDYQANAKHSLVGRVLFTGNTRVVPHSLVPDNLLNTGGTSLGFDNLAQSYMVGDTWLKSPQTVVSGRLSVNYTNVHRLGAEFFNAGDLGVKNYYSYQPKYSLISVSAPGFSLGGGTQSDSTFRTFSSGLNGDVSMSRGRHQLAFGGAFIYVDSNSNANVQSPGQFTFNGSITGLPVADLMIGRTSSFVQAAPNTNYVRLQYVASYFADTWKVSPRWTLNYGVRWEPDLAEVLTLARIQNYSEERRAAGIRSTVFQKAPPGFYYLGDPGYPGKRGRDLHWFTMSPRLGFAWDVHGDGRTSVRGSTGISYERPNAQIHLWTSIAPPWGANVTINNALFDDPWANYPGGNPFPAQYGPTYPFPAFGDFTAVPWSAIKPSQVQNWNLSLQRQIGNNWLLAASYLGSHTIHMMNTEQLNPATYIPGTGDTSGNCFLNGQAVNFKVTAGAACSTVANTNQRRRLSLIDLQNTGQFVANLAEIQSNGNASYNGLLVDVRKRAAKGITFSANYTLSHCIAPEQDTLNGTTGVSPTNTATFPGDRNRGRGNCGSDRRHVTNLSAVAETPRFENRTLRTLVTGWRLATIYRYSTGAYLTITSGGGLDLVRDGTNVGGQPASFVGPSRYGDSSGRPRTNWFNTAAFAQPAIGTFGNLGIRNVHGPSQWQWDMQLSRLIPVKEKQRVEVRAEVFNVPNSFRPMDPITALNSTQFGILNTARDPRILEFALKYIF